MTDPWFPPHIWQRRPHDCGPCCLYMVLRHNGVEVSLKKVRRATSWGWGGTTLQGLARGAETLGLQAICARIDNTQLGEIADPIIAHIGKRHFIVVLGASTRQVEAVDPRLGFGHVSRDVFYETWSGNVLLLSRKKPLAYSEASRPPCKQVVRCPGHPL